MARHTDQDNAAGEKIMRRRLLNAQRGMSLVEVTIILMVLSVLTAVLAPSIGDYVEEAKNTKAKEDVEAVGTSIVRLTRDVGQPCLKKATASPCNLVNRVDLLLGGGNDPSIDTSAGFAVAFTFPAGSDNDAGAINWKAIGSTAPTETDTLDSQFVTNGPVYPGPNYALGGGPKAGLGWRGPYLSGPIGQDPWGNRYEASTAFPDDRDQRHRRCDGGTLERRLGERRHRHLSRIQRRLTDTLRQCGQHRHRRRHHVRRQRDDEVIAPGG